LGSKSPVVNNQVVLTTTAKARPAAFRSSPARRNSGSALTAGSAITGTSRSGASVAQGLNQAFAANPTSQAAGLAVDYGVTHAGKVTIKPSNRRY
jgi:hypothetical protein